MANKDEQRPIEERWAADNERPDKGINVTAPSEETLAWAAWFREQQEKIKE